MDKTFLPLTVTAAGKIGQKTINLKNHVLMDFL